MSRLLYLISATVFIIGGIRVINTKTYEFRYYSPLQLGEYSVIIGSLIIVIGFILLYFYYTYKQNIEYSKCPKCKTSYRYETLKDGICPTCNIKTIETEKYYQKYSEEIGDI